VNTFAEQLRPFFPYFPSGLISARCLDQIESVTQHLPEELGVGPFMFECGLDARPAADFSVAVFASRGDHAALSRPGTMVTPDTADWSRIRRYARSWADPSSALSGAVDEAWLEFDVGLRGAAPCTTPSVFVGLDGPASDLSREHIIRVARECLVLLQGRPLPPGTLANLTECFALLPADARILYGGAMLSRRSDAVRVVTCGMDLADMVRLLQQLGLRRAEEHLVRLADTARMADELWLAIDVNVEGVGPRVGLDCYCYCDRDGPNGRTWAGLLDHLVDQGVCTGAKRDALLDATDMSYRTFDKGWPERLRRMAMILGPNGFDRMALYVHHIKVITGPGERLEAKGYLCGAYR
jgi:hypothetical protein